MGQRLFLCIECILWSADDNGIDILHLEGFGGIFAVVSPYFSECCNKSFDVFRTIPDGDVGEQICNITKLCLNVIFIAQDVIDLDSRESCRARKNRKLRCIEIVDCRAID